MDNRYILTPSGTFVSTDELYHWGIRGMKWGQRRYQNPDGSLTPAGRKRYTNPDGSFNEKGKAWYKNERARLKAEKEVLDNQKRTNSKLARLDAARKGNEDLKNQLNGKKRNESDDAEHDKRSEFIKSLDEMSDSELKKRYERMNTEDNYTKKMAERGFVRIDEFTEMDRKIAELKKQKEYLTLQDEVKKLTPEKTSKGKKLVNTLFDKVIAPAATEAGKKFLADYLTDAGKRVLEKKGKKYAEQAKKEADKVADSLKKQAEKEAKRREEEMRKYEEYNRQYTDPPRPNTSYRRSGGERTQTNPNESRAMTIYNRPVTGMSTKTKSRGRSYVNNSHINWDDYVDVTDDPNYPGNRSASSSTILLGQRTIAGYLPAPKDDD